MVRDDRQLRLLLVEDNLGDVVILREFVAEHMPFAVVDHAASWQNAQAILHEQHSTYDVVLLDLTLPDAAGIDLVRTTVEQAHDVPVIVLTGQSEVPLALPAMSAGATDYLQKDDISPISVYKSIVYAMERRVYAATLHASEQRYLDLFQLCPLPMWLFDVETRRFLDVNRAAVRHYGWTREEFLSMTILDIRPPEEHIHLEQALRGVHGKREWHNLDPFVHWTKDGRRIMCDIQSSLLTIEGREARLVVSTDVTANLAYLDAIQRQNEQLRAIAWMQSHAVRGPLTSLMSVVALIEEGLVETAELPYLCLQISTSAHRLDDVIRGIVEQTKDAERLA